MDTYERVSPDALRKAAVIMATVLYDAAMRDAKIPRKPMPKEEPRPTPTPSAEGKREASAGR